MTVLFYQFEAIMKWRPANLFTDTRVHGFIIAFSVVAISFLVARKLHRYKMPISLRNDKVVFDPADFDFGVSSQHKLIDHKFRLLNRDDKPVVVIGEHTTCSCTVVRENILGKIIPPSGSLEIPVNYDTGLKEGESVASLTIYWQEGKMDAKSMIYESQANLQGDVVPEFVIEPRTVNFGELKPGETATNIVVFYPGNATHFTIGNVRTTSSAFKAAVLTGKNISAEYKNSIAQLAIIFYAPEVSYRETLNDIVHFTSSSKQVPAGEIPIQGRVVPDIEVAPQIIVLPSNGAIGISEIKVRTHYPSRILRIFTSSMERPLRSGDSYNFHIAPEKWDTIHHWNIPNKLIACANRINFELEVRNDTGRVEARSVSVLIKSLDY